MKAYSLILSLTYLLTCFSQAFAKTHHYRFQTIDSPDGIEGPTGRLTVETNRKYPKTAEIIFESGLGLHNTPVKCTGFFATPSGLIIMSASDDFCVDSTGVELEELVVIFDYREENFSRAHSANNNSFHLWGKPKVNAASPLVTVPLARGPSSLTIEVRFGRFQSTVPRREWDRFTIEFQNTLSVFTPEWFHH